MDFIQEIAGYIQKYSKQYGMLVNSPEIAQAILESAKGTSELGVNANNFFGLKYTKGRCPTCSGIYHKVGSEQNADGSYVSSSMAWCMFDTMEDGVIGYFDFLKNGYGRYDNLIGVTNPKTYLELIKEDGYATSINYVDNLMNVIEEYDLTKYDEKGNGTMAKILIALSDGHGAETPGKRTPYIASLGREIRENEFNREVTKYLDVALKRCGFDTLLVAPTDADTPLADRVNLANSKKADAYISNHYNASDGRFDGESIDASGTEVWCWGDTNGTRLATFVYNEIIQGTTQKGRGVKVSKSFYELSKTNMIAIIIENGFMDNEREAMLMLNVEYQKEQAEQQCKGICKYFGVAYVEETKPTVPTAPTAPTVPAKGMYEISLSEIKAKGYDGITIVE